MTAVTDGLSNTIFMAEKAMYQDSTEMLGISTRQAVLRASDCMTTATNGKYTVSTSPDVLGNGRGWASAYSMGTYVTTNMPPNGPSCYSEFATATSRHTGGVHALMGDGSVRFINQNIDTGDLTATIPSGSAPSPYGVWGALGTRASSESVNDF